MNKKNRKRVEIFRFKKFSRKSYAVFASFKEFSIGVVVIGVLTFAGVRSTWAQSKANETNLTHSELQLDEVEITGSRIGQNLAQIQHTQHVLLAEDIQNMPAQNLQDLLHYLPGVDVQQRGGHGVQADVSVRGGSFDQTSIFINGVPLSNPQTGHFMLDLPINLNDIEQIEVFYGPSSSLYGGGAVANGINLVTKKADKKEVYASFQGGKHKLLGLDVGVAWLDQNSEQLASYSHKKSDGYRHNTDYTLQNAWWQANWKGNGGKLDVQAGYNNKQYGANTFYSPKYPNQYDKTENYLASARWQGGTKLQYTPVVYWNRHKDCFQLIRDDQSTVPYNYHQTDVWGADWQWHYFSTWGVSALTTSYRNEKVYSTVLGKTLDKPKGKYMKEDSRSEQNYGLEHTYKKGKWLLSGIVLLNHTSLDKGISFYPALSASYQANINWQYKLLWNKSRRLPTFTDLYYNTATHQGNTHLLAEKIEMVSVETRYQTDLFSGYLLAYTNKGKELIDWVWDAKVQKWQSTNHASVQKYGVEIGGTFSYKKAKINVDYARLYQDSPDINREQSSHYVLNYLRDKLSTQLQTSLWKDKLFASCQISWQKRMGGYDYYQLGFDPIRKEFASYAVVDAKLRYLYNKNLEMGIEVYNLLDREYSSVANIPQAGLWWVGSISYHFSR